MKRWIFFVFGVFCHAMFLVVFLCMAGFVANVWMPKSIDAPAVQGSALLSAMIDLSLLVLFAVPHSVMARPAFKRQWTRIVPATIERSVYVLISNVLVILLLALWRPFGPVIYDISWPMARAAMWMLFAAGWVLVPTASLMISHFDLFGTRQVWLNLQQKAYTYLPFHTPMLYQFVRHPLYVGWIIAFWATPTMSAGHLLFAVTLTLYMLAAIPLEERDLEAVFGDQYVSYRQRVGGLVPRIATMRRSKMIWSEETGPYEVCEAPEAK